jgi:hypothetical protein
MTTAQRKKLETIIIKIETLQHQIDDSKNRELADALRSAKDRLMSAL